MKNSFTLNDLIRFVCGDNGEVGLSDSEVACKPGDQYCKEDRKSSNNELLYSGLPISPDKRIINNILNYSRALSIVNTKNSGNFNLLLN